MTRPSVNTRRHFARKAKVHELVVFNEEEARNPCWRIDVLDDEWQAGTTERFGRLLLMALGKPSSDWQHAVHPSPLGIDLTTMTDDHARSYLERVRWPEGVICPRCGCVKVYPPTTRKNYKCAGCRRTFTTMHSTLFQDHKIPIHKLLQFIHAICTPRTVSILQVNKRLGFASYAAAHRKVKQLRSLQNSLSLVSR